MASMLAFKVVLLVLLAGVPTSIGVSTYYNQQQTNTLNNRISDLGDKLDTANSLASGLNEQFNSQISQLKTDLSQLQSQISQLHGQIALLNQTTSSQILTSGSAYVPFNGVEYVTFTVPSLPAYLNVSFTITDFNSFYPQSVAPYLLNATQYNLFQSGNYSSSTWAGPFSTSITATRITIPITGTWYLAFREQDPGGGYAATVQYTLKLAKT